MACHRIGRLRQWDSQSELSELKCADAGYSGSVACTTVRSAQNIAMEEIDSFLIAITCHKTSGGVQRW